MGWQGDHEQPEEILKEATMVSYYVADLIAILSII
jgi:hypothetical protein